MVDFPASHVFDVWFPEGIPDGSDEFWWFRCTKNAYHSYLFHELKELKRLAWNMINSCWARPSPDLLLVADFKDLLYVLFLKMEWGSSIDFYFVATRFKKTTSQFPWLNGSYGIYRVVYICVMMSYSHLAHVKSAVPFGVLAAIHCWRPEKVCHGQKLA